MTSTSMEDNIKLLVELAQRQDNTLTGFMIKTDRRFDSLEDRFDGLESRFDGLEKRLDQVEIDVAEIKGDIKEIKALLIKGS